MPSPRKLIVMISPPSQYGTTQYFVRDLSDSFKALGYQVLTLTPAGFRMKAPALLFHPSVYFIFGMNGWGFEAAAPYLIRHKLPVPFVVYLLDHPLYHAHRINFRLASRKLIVSCIDHVHARDIQTFFKGHYQLTFIPQGSHLAPAIGKLSLPMEKRPIPLMFAGTYMDENQPRRQWMNHPVLGKVFDEIAERALYQHQASVAWIASGVFREKGFPFRMPQDKVLNHLLNQIDLYVRARRRREVLEALAPLNLLIYNSRWSYLSKKGAVVKPAIDFLSMHKVLAQTQITVNILPNYSKGGHERIFTAFLAGSVSLTDENNYLNRIFQDGHSALFYHFKNLPSVPARLERYMKHPDLLTAIAQNGRRNVLQGHLWRHRAVKILQEVKRNWGR